MTTKTAAKVTAVGICSGLMAGMLRFTSSCRFAILRHSYAAIAAPRANNILNAGARAQAKCTSKRAMTTPKRTYMTAVAATPCCKVRASEADFPLPFRESDRCSCRRVDPTHDCWQQRGVSCGYVLLQQVAQIRQRADGNHRQPNMIRCEWGRRRHRLVRNKWEDDSLRAAGSANFSGGARVDQYREKVQSLQANSRLYAVRS